MVGSEFGTALEAFLARFGAAREQPFKSDTDLAIAAERIEQVLRTSDEWAGRPDVIFKWSAGKGVWASVPWFALLDSRLTTSTQRGVYIVLLVSQDLSCAYLTLNQGMTELVEAHGQAGAVQLMKERAAAFRQRLGHLQDVGFQLDGQVDLATRGWRSKNYEVGTIAHKRYDRSAPPTDEEVVADVSALLGAYETITSPGADATTRRATWFVGSTWGDRDEDQTTRFLAQGIWENVDADQALIEQVQQIEPGDRIAIKAAFVRKLDLPFPYPTGQSASAMRIKATGVVTANPGDGTRLEVAWDPGSAPRDWFFFTGRATVWRVDPGSEPQDQLIAFAFDGKDQDYDWFLARSPWRKGEADALAEAPQSSLAPAYTIDDALDGLFMERTEFERLLSIWRTKKNLVLQGAPGVGKSFVARRLAYALMEHADPARVAAVQFHQSYGYEDFMQGYRPTASGGFELRNGVFHRFCEQARKDPSRPHVFIIDEINRGNLSKVFGELMLLIEADKRGPTWTTQLAYSSDGDEPFWVPPNLYILGMMNTADRSLSLVDYALRRRFGFVTLEPAFASDAFRKHLLASGVGAAIIDRITHGMMELNAAIASDAVNLGAGFRIGHSFFTPAAQADAAWLEQVIETEIRPLLEEYWFDDPEKARQWRDRLLAL